MAILLDTNRQTYSTGFEFFGSTSTSCDHFDAMVERVSVGLVGAGFVAQVHVAAYAGIDAAEVQWVAASGMPTSSAFAEEHRIQNATTVDRLLACDEIDVVDVCVPNRFHEQIALRAIEAGKHVILEKPLTGYFDAGDDASTICRRVMFEGALRSADRIIDASEKAGVKVMYAENWLYSPVIQKAKRLLKSSGGVVLEMRGEESHHGSHSPAARKWANSGGGSLIRLGSHPIGVMLHLKQCEGEWRGGQPILPVQVLADVTDLTKTETFRRANPAWIANDWQDVENWATTIITFSDGTKGLVSANDICLGGMKDTLDIYASNCRLHCDLSQSNALRAYAPDPAPFSDEYLTEKLETKAGWSFPSVSEEWLLGYRQELVDFVDAVRFDRAPLSDARLGRLVLQVIYGSYVSAAEERAVTLGDAFA